ncbi:MAG TPA: sigma 54-interacting transcriptional regulator, partial [Rhodocyclaceae bacterium]|uniref:sigma 54-interacting transcriptional regulator n=1 Tax=Accumulibacter sp. TaxID=2053492 RepID=UPI002C7E3DCB
LKWCWRGTLFLEEIGDMPLSVQAKLLRALQEHRLRRLGGETTIAVDFRLVCATHCNLKAMIEDGRFREDLHYRINVIHLRIPPLRERKEASAWFMQQFVEAFNRAHPEKARRIDPRTQEALARYRGHMTHSAEALGITRKTLWEKMRRLGLQARDDA